MTDTRILLATPHAGYEQRVRGAFGNALNGTLHRWDPSGLPMTFEALAVQLGDPSPDVVALGPDLDVGLVLDIARRLEQDRPEVHVVLVATPTPQLWQEALRAGVHDIVAPDAPDTELRGVFNRTLQVAARRRRSVSDDDAASTARVITVVSPKGGSGKTTMATNLAVAIAVQAPDRVVLVDLDVQFGDVTTALRLTPEHTLADALRSPADLDGLALKSLLTPHDSGLWVLCGPRVPADAEDIPPARLQTLIRTLAREFSYVVIDTAAGLVDHTLAAIEISTDLVLLSAMDIPSVNGLRKEIDSLDQLGMTRQRRLLVVNHADRRVGLALSDIEASIGLPIVAAVPSTRTVAMSTNYGTPVVTSHPRSAVARRLSSLAAQITDEAASRNGRAPRKAAR